MDGAALFDEVRAFLLRFVVFQSEAQVIAVTLWSVHTHAIDAFATTPRLSVRSPEKESGKTRLLECLELLVRNPVLVANISDAALFRLVASEQPTLLHDEIDATFGPKARDREDLRALLNAGHRRRADVPRCVGDGAKMTVKRFPVFAPVALAGIGALPDTIESRSIIVALKRRAPGEFVEDFEYEAAEADGRDLHDALAQWAEANLDRMRALRPARVDGVRDRAADNWRALLAVAELAGGEWPGLARAAARELTGGPEDEQSRGVQLLRDLQAVFTKDRMASAELCGQLNAREDRPWGAWNRGEGMTPRSLAHLLRPYGVRPHKLRFGDQTVNGYESADLVDAWQRYLGCSASVPEPQAQHRNNGEISEDSPIPDLCAQELKSSADQRCSDVPPEHPERSRNGADALIADAIAGLDPTHTDQSLKVAELRAAGVRARERARDAAATVAYPE